MDMDPMICDPEEDLPDKLPPLDFSLQESEDLPTQASMDLAGLPTYNMLMHNAEPLIPCNLLSSRRPKLVQ